MRFRTLCLTATAAAAVSLAACGDEPLAVENLDNPDVERSYSTPDGIEAILRTGFAQILNATHGVTVDNVWLQTLVLSFESYGSVANGGMSQRAALPRTPLDNTRGNQTASGNFRDFAELSKRGRQIANGIAALDRLLANNGSLGSASANSRARAFGFFNLALANGELALMYDSVAVSTPLYGTTDSLNVQAVPPLVGYMDGMAVALAQLDSAEDIAMAGASFELPDEWLRTTGDVTSRDGFVRIVRSTRARLRAGVARTPEERAAVDWAAVEADAAGGIVDDVMLDLSAVAGWGVPWLNQLAVYTGWHMMPPPIIGMADTSGAYEAWLAQDVGSRTQFNIRTPDTRFPSDDLGAASFDEVREAQMANSPAAAEVLPDVYFMNRDPGDDTRGDAWSNSPYDFVRFRSYREARSTGPWPWMTAAEIAMLRAEALIRLGRAAEAVPLINASRTAHGLPPFPAGSTADTPAPGGNACVPQVPAAPSFTTTVCGNLFEAMKWEKRLETLMTGYAQWYVDGRGWGDLAEGTPVMWPVPYQEMDARASSTYNSQVHAPRGTYGF